MRLEKIGCIALCLVLSTGLIFVHGGLCQPAKPDEAGTKVPAVSPEGKAPAPQAPCPAPAKEPGPGKAEAKPPVPGQPPETQPAKSEPREGC